MLAVCATGLIASTSAHAQSSITVTVSTSSSQVLHDSTAMQRVDTYATQIIGRIEGGPTLFDQTYSFAYGSGQVAAGVGDAQAALAGYFGSTPFSLFGPTQLGSTQSLVSSVSGAPVVTNTTSAQTVTLEETLGPATILIGNRDLGGTPFIVLAGTINLNENTHTHFDIFRTLTTTDTYQTVASYEIIGRPVPEPSTWALLAGGLALLGWRARRRRPSSAISIAHGRVVAMLAVCTTGLIASAGAQAQATGSENTTFTLSTSSSEVLHDSTDTQRVDTYATQIVGRIAGGPTLFDQTYSFAYGSGQVAAGIGDAQAALASYFGANPFSLFGPTQLGSTQSLIDSVSGAPVVINTTSAQTVTLETQIGPGTMIIGNRDLGGTPFIVLAGTTNFNFHTHTQFDIFRTITTTDTYQTVASYEIIGRPVPEPSTWLLLASGLLLVGFKIRQSV